MCQFEPSNVLPFLKSRSGGYRLDACLEQCQNYGVVDASAHILEKMGRVGDALDLHVQKYEQNVEALSNLRNNPTSSTVNKMSKDVSRGFAMESSESLDAATRLCLRCDTYKFIESEAMHRLLDCVISARITYGSSGQFVDQTLREHVERILHDTLERVAPEKVLGDVLRTRGNESLRELRRVLTGILETVESEKDGVRKEEKVSERKVLKAAAEKLCALKRGRRANDVKLVVTQQMKQSSSSPLSSSSSRQKRPRRKSFTKTATTTPTRTQLAPKRRAASTLLREEKIDCYNQKCIDSNICTKNYASLLSSSSSSLCARRVLIRLVGFRYIQPPLLLQPRLFCFPIEPSHQTLAQSTRLSLLLLKAE